MRISPFETMAAIEVNENSTVCMEIVVVPGREVNASVYWSLNEEMIDNTHWCWLETVRDHGKSYCKECRENGDTKDFDTSEALYLDHFSSIIEAVGQARELGYVFARVGEDWHAVNLPKSADEQCPEGRVKLPIGKIELLPLKARKGRHKHARAIHALIAAHTGLSIEQI